MGPDRCSLFFPKASKTLHPTLTASMLRTRNNAVYPTGGYAKFVLFPVEDRRDRLLASKSLCSLLTMLAYSGPLLNRLTASNSLLPGVRAGKCDSLIMYSLENFPVCELAGLYRGSNEQSNIIQPKLPLNTEATMNKVMSSCPDCLLDN